MNRVRFRAAQVVFSVEHASARVPAELAGLGLRRDVLASHHAWDPGAAIIGRRLAKAFAGPLHLGRWSRLVADLNRSRQHPRVVARTLSDGKRVPANAELSREQRAQRIDRFWRPWRKAVEADLDAAVVACGLAFHISIHSFTGSLNGDRRDNDFGLLYEPSHPREKAMADRLHTRIEAQGYSVRRNYPYSGKDDGFCMRMRRERSTANYIGMEFEMNQLSVVKPEGARRFAQVLISALRGEIA